MMFAGGTKVWAQERNFKKKGLRKRKLITTMAEQYRQGTKGKPVEQSIL